MAFTENEMIGWVHDFVAHRMESKPFVEIGGLVVDEMSRSEGTGKRLVEEMAQWCFQKEIYSLRVRSNVKRNEAHRFYAALGFNTTKAQKVFEKSLQKNRKAIIDGLSVFEEIFLKLESKG